MTELGVAAVGLALVYFVPGFAVVRAVFPERRVLRPFSLATLVEQATLGFVLSVGLTVLVGFALLGTSSGFAASWSDPQLEIALGAIAVVAFVAAAGRGSFARVPPKTAPAIDAGADPLPTLRTLERLQREERRLRRAHGRSGAGANEITTRLEAVRQEIGRIEAAREAELGRT